MPLRDHFRPPLDDFTSWEGMYGGWPAVMVQHLNKVLPPEYAAAPRVHLGSPVESDDPDEYEVRVYDAHRGRRLVAAVELISPANKDRPEHRRIFVARCAALLQQRVSVVLVDIVTVRQLNLYAELLGLLGVTDPGLGETPSALYAGCCRRRPGNGVGRLETWYQPLQVGRPLPTLPLWLSDEFAVPLALEESYEQTCRDLRLP